MRFTGSNYTITVDFDSARVDIQQLVFACACSWLDEPGELERRARTGAAGMLRSIANDIESRLDDHRDPTIRERWIAARASRPPGGDR